MKIKQEVELRDSFFKGEIGEELMHYNLNQQ